jgi:primosomal protein N' (replication factor Y)
MTGEPRRVRVAVEALADRPERTFSYLLPSALGEARPGALVLVPYGRRLALGYVMPGDDEEAAGELRDVEAIVSEPMLTPDLLELAEAIAAYYRAPIGTTLAAMLPPGLESRLVRRWATVSGKSRSVLQGNAEHFSRTLTGPTGAHYAKPGGSQ